MVFARHLGRPTTSKHFAKLSFVSDGILHVFELWLGMPFNKAALAKLGRTELHKDGFRAHIQCRVEDGLNMHIRIPCRATIDEAQKDSKIPSTTLMVRGYGARGWVGNPLPPGAFKKQPLGGQGLKISFGDVF